MKGSFDISMVVKIAVVAVATLLFMVVIAQTIPEAAQNAVENMAQ